MIIFQKRKHKLLIYYSHQIQSRIQLFRIILQRN